MTLTFIDGEKQTSISGGDNPPSDIASQQEIQCILKKYLCNKYDLNIQKYNSKYKESGHLT